MSFKPYNLDRKAQKLVLKYRDRDVLNESHKMRATVPYGLERFWGEHLRLLGQAQRLSNPSTREEARNKAHYWKETWIALVEIMREAGIRVPNDNIDLSAENSTKCIEKMAEKLWDDGSNSPFPEKDRKVALAVLIQFCDSLVWWTQRYKKVSEIAEGRVEERDSDEG